MITLLPTPAARPGPATDRPERPPPTAYIELLRSHDPRMLVVEDDPALEPLVRRAVGALRPAVAVDWCRSVADARRLLAERFYDLVLVDYSLEGDTPGIALRTDCSGLQPQAVFAMTSAYPLSEYLHSVGPPGSPFLHKPFGPQQCREFVAALLSRSTPQ